MKVEGSKVFCSAIRLESKISHALVEQPQYYHFCVPFRIEDDD